MANRKRAQNLTEYLILMAGVLTVVILAANSRGIFTQAVNKSINMMFDSVEEMATVACLGTIDDVNGKWSGWSAWAGCSWDAVSSSCLEYSTRACNSPEPKCGGSPCQRLDSSYTTLTSPSETQSQGCYLGSWQTGACPPAGCTGSCGSTVGTCVVAVTCPPDNCCDPAAKPSTTIACTKPAYPDVWSGLGFGSCSTSCGEGISSQTVTCSGMCCDAAIKPPTRRACTDGCCAQVLDIGLDIENNVQFTGTFGPSGPGPYSVSCPSGYAGNPTSTCTAWANSAGCTGNDSYVPPSSCYTINWGPVSNTCVPADCPGVTVDAGYGRTWNVPFTLHGNTATLTCSDGGWSYTGTASYDCWLGQWRNLNAGCIPNCPVENNVYIGADLYVTFPETVSGGSVNLTCSSYDAGVNPGDKKYVGNVSRSCGIGTWSGVSGSCDYKPCGTQYYMDPNGFVQGTFTASPHGTPVTVTCSDVDSRYDGSFSRTCTYGDWLNPTGGCTAKACTDWTTNVGGVNITFTASPHGTVQPQNCSNFDNTYTGTVAAECNFGNWINLSGGCTPNCPTQNLDIGSGLTGSFAEIASGQTRYATCPGGYSGTPNRFCSSGTWGVLNNGCTPNSCVTEVLDIGGGLTGTFFAGPSGTTRTLSCPGGYSGSPSRTCTAGSWGSLSNGCVCVPACPVGSCGWVNNAATCWTNTWCGSCCGNGAIDSGEVCDGTNLNGQTCSSLGYTGTGTPPGCNASCTAFTQGSCCDAVNGTWGAPWTNVGSCGTYTACFQRQQGTCNGASCGGTCSGSGTQNVACGAVDGVWGGWVTGSCSVSCGGGTLTDTRTCSAPVCGGTECTRLDGTLTTSGNRTETRTGGSCNTQACPQWVASSSPGCLSCSNVCAGVGMSSGFDPNGKTCLSSETSSSGGGSIMTTRCRTTSMSGCGTGGVRCGVGNYRTNFFCYNSGQRQDSDNTDKITSCYCIP